MKSLIEFLSKQPRISNPVRWILEGGFAGHRRMIRQHLGPDISRGGRILDIGCGTGMLASAFPGHQYSGVDLSPENIRFARRRYPRHEFAVMDATHLTFSSASFDLALICGLLHHLDDDNTVAVIQEAIRVLSPQGRLLIHEDCSSPDGHRLGRLIQRLDAGGFVRSAVEWQALVNRAICQSGASKPVSQLSFESMRSGVMDYSVFLLQCELPSGNGTGSATPDSPTAVGF